MTLEPTPDLDDELPLRDPIKLPTWFATPTLRWHGTTLEQKWMCLEDNAVEWRAVPVVQ